jgi:hypothetical protein
MAPVFCSKYNGRVGLEVLMLFEGTWNDGGSPNVLCLKIAKKATTSLALPLLKNLT